MIARTQKPACNRVSMHIFLKYWQSLKNLARISLGLLIFSCFLTACAHPVELLPYSLYYLDGRREQLQVWRLEADGSTKGQVTHEEAGILEFAVSPADGSLAFVSNNQLFLVDGQGENRRLIADGSQVDQNIEDYIFRSTVSTPVFSPDGKTLSYAFDGLHLYNLATGKDEHVLTNLGNLNGEPFVFVKENYYPGPWSADGRKLLIIMGYYEGSTLAVMDREAGLTFTRMLTHGPVCCLFSWTEDGQAVLVANPYYTVDRPGLWGYNPETGKESLSIISPEDGSSNDYIGWPYQLPSGQLVYFHANLEHFSPDVGIPLVMVRSNPDGSNRTQLRPEVFKIRQALWAQDGSFVLIAQYTGDGSEQIVLVPAGGGPSQVLVEGEEIMYLTWGP
jgi:hypothetical protein